MEIIIYHIIAFVIGCALDCIIGDPYNLPHPIRLIGRVIAFLDRSFLGDKHAAKAKTDSLDDGMESEHKRNREVILGIITWIIVVLSTGLATLLVCCIAYRMHVVIGIIVEAILTCYIMAAKSLADESHKVLRAVESGDIDAARYAVSMIVGRDTNVLSMEGVIKATVETVAENTSDGVIAPLLYTCLGGPVLGLAYKAINTMDSMIGYHNDRYEYYGKAAAIADDVANYIPARISAYLMIAASALSYKEYDYKEAYRIYKRDRYNHKSPNSAHCESVCAGALRVQLAGDASYLGVIVKKPYIGDATRLIEADDINRAIKLMRLTAVLTFVLLVIVMGICVIV